MISHFDSSNNIFVDCNLTDIIRKLEIRVRVHSKKSDFKRSFYVINYYKRNKYAFMVHYTEDMIFALY